MLHTCRLVGPCHAPARQSEPHSSALCLSVTSSACTAAHVLCKPQGLAVANVRFIADVDINRLVMPPRPQPSIAHDVEPVPDEDLVSSPEVYNIELSWLAFNWRVLSMALLPKVPLLERLQFLAITSANLDGFFQKRVGGIMKQQAAGLQNMKKSPMQMPAQQLEAISSEVKRMFRWHSWTLQTLVLPQLREQGICLLTPDALSVDGTEYLRAYYVEQVDKLLTPIKCAPAPRPVTHMLCTKCSTLMLQATCLSRSCFHAQASAPRQF